MNTYLRINQKSLNGLLLHSPLDNQSKGRNQTYEGALRLLVLEIQKKERAIVKVIIETPLSLRTGQP